MSFQKLTIEKWLNQSFFEGILVKLQELKLIGYELSPEFETARQEAIREIEDLLGWLLGITDGELAKDSEAFELLTKAAAVAEFLADAELLERIGNLQEIYE